MTAIDVQSMGYTDNSELLAVATRLIAEIKSDPSFLDIVTGYIEPTAWSVLGDALADLKKARILLGKDYQLAPPNTGRAERDIASLVEEAIRTQTTPNPLPEKSDALAISLALQFLRRDEVRVKVWTNGFLHAKAYLLPRSAGVGSANFTAGGLIRNRELVSWREDRSVLHQLQQWYDGLWDHPDSQDYKDGLIEAFERTAFGTHPYTPYELLIRVLASRYGDERPPSLEAADFKLQWFQEDAVFRLIQMIDQPAHGALLADAVGLGKTYMAFGVIHHYLYNNVRSAGSGPPVLVIVPASLQGIWERLLRKYGLLWACRIITVQSLDRDMDTRPYTGAGLVVIDEAHRLRGRNVWFRSVLDILTRGAPDKRVLLLTATPINTGLRDLTAMLLVLTKNRRNVYAPAIADFEVYLKRVERGELEPFPILDRAIVRRSRSDIIKDYDERMVAGIRNISKPKLPDRKLFHSTYRYTTGASDELFNVFATALRSLRLAPYDLEPYQRSHQLSLDDEAEGPVHQPNSMAALVAAGLFKRFESSLEAIRLSLKRIDVVMRRFSELLAADPPRLLRLSQNPDARALIAEERETDEDGAGNFDDRWAALIRDLPPLDPENDIDFAMVQDAIAHDREAVARLLDALPLLGSDGKLAAVRSLFASGGVLHGKRALLFTQFRDTAVYVYQNLNDDEWRAHTGLGPVALLHGGIPAKDKARIAATFDPDQSDDDLLQAFGAGEEVPQVLVSTDVLAEGHNLQKAEAVVNLDLPWNPQVAVQRAGRIDRLGSPHDRILIGSFEPEEGLEAHLHLVEALDRRFRLIHHLGMGDEPVMRLAGDQQRITFEQMRRLYNDDVGVLDELERTWTLGSTDFMRAPLEAYLNRYAKEQLQRIPVGVQSVKRLPLDWTHGVGVFVAFDYEKESIWRFYPRTVEGPWGTALSDETRIFRAIACTEGERRADPPDPADGPGGVIDWVLLSRAAEEVAEELTRRRATAAIQRGASERSRQLRQQIREIRDLCGEVEGVDDLLDRLEEVRVEDFDHRPENRSFRAAVAAARKATSTGERHDYLVEVARRGLEVLGQPVGAVEAEPDHVHAKDLRLVAWEVLVEASPATKAAGQQMTMEHETITAQSGELILGDQL
jgi:superfamily II DNA or RNA helicase